MCPPLNGAHQPACHTTRRLSGDEKAERRRQPVVVANLNSNREDIATRELGYYFDSALDDKDYRDNIFLGRMVSKAASQNRYYFHHLVIKVIIILFISLNLSQKLI